MAKQRTQVLRQMVNEPYSRNDGHKVGDGTKAGKSLTSLVKKAEAERAAAEEARQQCAQELESMRGLAREVRDMQMDIQRRVRRAVWVIATIAVLMVTAIFWAVFKLVPPSTEQPAVAAGGSKCNSPLAPRRQISGPPSSYARVGGCRSTLEGSKVARAFMVRHAGFDSQA